MSISAFPAGDSEVLVHMTLLCALPWAAPLGWGWGQGVREGHRTGASMAALGFSCHLLKSSSFWEIAAQHLDRQVPGLIASNNKVMSKCVQAKLAHACSEHSAARSS